MVVPGFCSVAILCHSAQEEDIMARFAVSNYSSYFMIICELNLVGSTAFPIRVELDSFIVKIED